MSGKLSVNNIIPIYQQYTSLFNARSAPLLLAFAVNIAGFDLAIGSMANIIALRMAGEPAIWWRFHLYSFPLLGWAAAVGYWLISALGR